MEGWSGGVVWRGGRWDEMGDGVRDEGGWDERWDGG